MHILNNEFDKSIDNLKIEINRIVGKVEGLTPQEVRERLSETISNDEYDRLLKLYKTIKDPDVKKQIEKQLKLESIKYRVKRKEAMIQAINRERVRLTDTQLTNAKEHLSSVYIDSYQLFTNNRVSISELENVLNSKWNGGNYSSRIWNNQKVMAKSLKSELMQAFISGKTEKQMADILVEYTDYSRHVANRLIRTETSYMVNVADLNDSKRRGIKAKRFEAHLDSRTSRLCRAHNQTIIPIDKIKIGVNAPPLHPYCRYFLSDVLEGWDYETDEELQALINENIDNNAENGYNKISGGISGAITNTLSDKAERHAELRYEFIRNNKYDVEKIAKNTGYSVAQIQSIKNYLFIDKHDLGDKIDRFVPDFCIAQSWDRLTTGKIEKHDLILLKHEIMEQELIENGLTQDEAHKITSQKYNYQKEAEEFYDQLKERKKRKK